MLSIASENASLNLYLDVYVFASPNMIIFLGSIIYRVDGENPPTLF